MKRHIRFSRTPIFLFFTFWLFVQCSPEEAEVPTTTDPNATDTTNTPPANTNYSNANTAHLAPVSITPLAPCENGSAGDYPCAGYDLYSFLPLDALSATFINDIWGWTDETTAKEYVILGLSDGTAFLDISDPKAPKYLGKLPTHTEPKVWRDVKVYKDHAFIVSEAANHGMQVFDLTRLRTVTAPEQFSADAHLNVFRSAHNIVINETSGYAYIVGTSGTVDGVTFHGGVLMVDIRNPKNPTPAGSFRPNLYVHDAQVVTYQGPDSNYSGRELLFGSSSDGNTYNDLIIVDVSNKAQPRLISATTYPLAAYTHQNWLTEDQRYALVGDEGDEREFGLKTRTIVIDVSDLDAPSVHFTYTGATPAIDHNGYVHGNSFFLASYSSGLREIDIAQIANKQMQEIAFFDTTPNVENTDFYGVWSIYPYFESGFIPISDSDNGLFIVRRALE